MLEENKMRVKLILLGDIGVGKSSIIQRYNEDIFHEEKESTYNSYFIEKEIKINDQRIILELWDTAGQEQYRSVTKIFVKNSKIIILVYDITSKKSFESLNYWYDYIVKELGPNVILGLAGNKTDLIFDDIFEEEVSPEKGKEYASQIGANFSLLSAKESSIEIRDLINALVTKYLDIKDDFIHTCDTIKIDERSFNREITNKSECCIGKTKNNVKLKAIFLGYNGVGKTTIIRAIKGNNNFNNTVYTKKEYKENIYYTKNGLNINVELKEINVGDNKNQNLEKIDGYKFFFVVFDIYKKNTLFDLKNLITKIDKKNKIYILGYNKDTSEDKISEYNYAEEVEKFAKQFGCEYEYITLDDLYKVKAIIIDNIGKYIGTLGY